jgi:hypothetical protein
MAEDINLNKEVFDKRSYIKTIDVTFNELGIQTVQQQLDEQPTVQEFFKMYNDLFYQINQFGPTESHEYLVKTSGEYISFEERDELINALQQEIATLRTQLLEAENNLANATLGGEEEIPTLEEVEIEPIENPINNTLLTPSPIEEEPQESPSTPVEAYVNNFNSENPGNGYKAFPISYRMLKNNFDYIDNNRKSDFPHDGSLVRSATGLAIKTYMAAIIALVQKGEKSALAEYDVELHYNFGRWERLRGSIKKSFNLPPISNIPGKNKIKLNIYYVISETVKQMQSHYKKNKNFNESGGYLK